MNEKTRELIAIGASVSSHCMPCLEYHLVQARALGIGEDEIRIAIEVGLQVEKSASTGMKQSITSILNQTKTNASPCCTASNSRCCG